MKRAASIFLAVVLAFCGSVSGSILDQGQAGERASAMSTYTQRVGESCNYVYSGNVKSCTSSDSRVATVYKRGKRKVKVTAKKKGTVKITVWTKKGKGSFKVCVKANPKSNSSSLERNITAGVRKLESGRVLFQINNNNSTYIRQIGVTYALYNGAGKYITNWTVYAHYLEGNRTYYTEYDPSYYLYTDMQRMDPSKTKIEKIEVNQRKDCMPMVRNIDASIKYIQEDGEEKVKVSLENKSQKTAYYDFCILFKDASGKIIDARSNDEEMALYPLDSQKETYDSAYNVFNNKSIKSKKCVLMLYAGDI